WREGNGRMLQQNVDGLFAVTDLCGATGKRFLPPGTEGETLLLPIDIEVSAVERKAFRAQRNETEGITLYFIGYYIPTKGHPFLIDALSGIDDPFYREHVDLLIVARLSPHRERQLAQLETRFRNVQVIASYARNQLVPLSQMIDLNIVPSIWWETFNQVTVEL